MPAPFSTPGIEHDSDCAQLEVAVCAATGLPHTLESWSGWPGAFCLRCGMEDKDEVCLADCHCPCHKPFWEEFERVCAALPGTEEGEDPFGA